MGSHSHSRSLKSQLTNGVGLAIRFLIVSDVLEE
jgi:uncharacterized membrane protein